MPLVGAHLGTNQPFLNDLRRLLEAPPEVLNAFMARDRSELRSVHRSAWRDLAESSGVSIDDVSMAATVASFLFLRRLAERLDDEEVENELREYAARLEVDAEAFENRIPALREFFTPTEADEVAIAEEAAKSAIGAGLTDVHIQWSIRPAITSANTVVAQHAVGQLDIHYLTANARHEVLVLEFDSEELGMMAAVIERAREELELLRATFNSERWIE